MRLENVGNRSAKRRLPTAGVILAWHDNRYEQDRDLAMR